MKMHAAHTQTILSRISAFSELAPIAAAHHERLDGKSYPLGSLATKSRLRRGSSRPRTFSTH